MSGGVGAGRIEDFDFYMGFLSSSVATRQLRLRAARPFCRSMPMAFPTFPPFCGGIARSGKPLCGCNAPELGKARDLLTQDFYMFLRCRYKQCKAREGQKDEIDLVGHRGLLPEAVTQQCAVDMPQKYAFVPGSFARRINKQGSG